MRRATNPWSGVHRRVVLLASVVVGVIAISGVFSWFSDASAAAGPTLEGAGSVVVYDSAAGGATVVDVNATGTGFTIPTVSGVVSGADTVGTAYLGGLDTSVDDVLFYSSVSSRFNFASVGAPDGAGHRELGVFVDVTGSRGWTHVVTGDYNGDGTTDILFYRATDGLMRFYTTSASGSFTPLTPVMYGNQGWTHLVVGDYDRDGSDDVLWYRARDGLMRFYEVTGAGVFRAISPVYYGTRNWTTIPSGDYDGNGSDDLLFYRGDGLARFYEVDSSGTFRALGSAFYPSGGYTQIESVELTPENAGVDLVWYHAMKDLLVATRYNTNGVANLWNAQSTAAQGDNLIIATGNFPPPSPIEFGDGTWLIGTDIGPGTYETIDLTPDGCYWERLSGLSGDFGDLIANDFTYEKSIVEIKAGDVAYRSDGCGDWTLPRVWSEPMSRFAGGTWLVGDQIQPGRYRNSGGDGCYWERLSGFSGGSDTLLANDYLDGSTVVDILGSDAGFSSSDCGTWSLVQP